MVPVVIWVASVAVGDLLAGLDGAVGKPWRARIGAVVAPAVAVAAGLMVGLPTCAVVTLGGIVAVTNAAWLGVRAPEDWSARRASVILLALGITLTAATVTAGAWPDPDVDLIRKWLRSLPFPAVEQWAVESTVTVVGAVLVIQATGNAVVRLVLSVAGTLPPSEQKLKGGRIIGPLERTLIFGLALTGEPTAAALVVSAKGLLRFPEISKEQDVHAATEYFLIGSLASWTVALGAAGLVGATVR